MEVVNITCYVGSGATGRIKIEKIKALASEKGLTVGKWLQGLVERELEALEVK